ncbi:hypothetical protein [Streptomyces sp. YS-3]|uniref:hypothetical protein n=1 Tax=Streptomyces sp. YS-3 TaxID=3381352 RepID=UPI003862545D
MGGEFYGRLCVLPRIDRISGVTLREAVRRLADADRTAYWTLPPRPRRLTPSATPLGFAEDVLAPEGVYVDQGGLQDPQAQNSTNISSSSCRNEYLLLGTRDGGDLSALP